MSKKTLILVGISLLVLLSLVGFLNFYDFNPSEPVILEPSFVVEITRTANEYAGNDLLWINITNTGNVMARRLTYLVWGKSHEPVPKFEGHEWALIGQVESYGTHHIAPGDSSKTMINVPEHMRKVQFYIFTVGLSFNGHLGRQSYKRTFWFICSG